MYFFNKQLYSTLGEEFEGERSFVPLNGFTEIMPGRITVPMIVSPDGKTYFDVAKGKIGGNIEFLTKENTTKSLIQGGKIVSDAIDANTIKVGTKTLITDGKLTTDLIDVNTLEARIVDTRTIRPPELGGGRGPGVIIDRRDLYALQVYNDFQKRTMYIDRYNNGWGMLTQGLHQNFTSLNNQFGLQFYDQECFVNNTTIPQAQFTRDGIKLPPTATVNMPGVLCAGSVSKGGNIVGKWGCITPFITKYNGITGQYKITHSLGHLNYYVNATPVGKDETWMKVHCVIIDKTPNYCVIGVFDSGQGNVTADYKVDFMIVGQNK